MQDLYCSNPFEGFFFFFMVIFGWNIQVITVKACGIHHENIA